MITRQYTTAQKRALSQVGNGAGRYDINPPFLALTPAGEPELYLNTLIGLSIRWLDQTALSAFFASYGDDPRQQDLDVIVWLGLENCLYEKELPHRPILSKMRRDYAAKFRGSANNLSRQQMMAMSAQVFTQRKARWEHVLGKESTLLPGERKLFGELMVPGSFTTDEVIERLRNVLATSFHVRFHDGTDDGKRRITPRMADVLSKILYRETRQRDSLLVRNGDSNAPAGKSRVLERGRRVQVQDERDGAYIRGIFGKPLYTDHEMDILNSELCQGDDAYCHLYIAGSRPGEGSESDREVAKVLADMEAQEKKNKAFYEKNAFAAASGIRSLAAQLDTILATYASPLPERSVSGRLEAPLAYRLALFQDPMVFTRPGDETEKHIRIDLLLDASASRLRAQEMIAAQTVVLAKSLLSVHVPVRVLAFRSLRGYTVLQCLKGYDEKDTSGIFSYFASGWNRDSLALKTVGRLILSDDPSEEDAHVLFVLTDANPDDSTHIPGEGTHLDEEYEGAAAVRDTADAVHGLRKKKIRTLALYLGSTAHVDNLHLIYGNTDTAVRNLETLSSRVADLLSGALTQADGT